jgi:hypothetical protein
VEEEVFERFEIHQLPVSGLREFLHAAARERIAGGRIYDAHIAEVARSAGARRVVTGNRRHFVSLLRYGIRVLTAEELVAEAGL